MSLFVLVGADLPPNLTVPVFVVPHIGANAEFPGSNWHLKEPIVFLPLRLPLSCQFRRNALSIMSATLSFRALAIRMGVSRFGLAILWLGLVFWMRVRGGFGVASATSTGVGS